MPKVEGIMRPAARKFLHLPSARLKATVRNHHDPHRGFHEGDSDGGGGLIVVTDRKPARGPKFNVGVGRG